MDNTMTVSGRKAARALRALDPDALAGYQDYWQRIVPVSDEEHYFRWLFAFMSIRARWRDNVNSFLSLHTLYRSNPRFSKEQLRSTLEGCSVGLFHMRTEGVWRFHQSFWSDPSAWRPGCCEDLRECRDRLA